MGLKKSNSSKITLNPPFNWRVKGVYKKNIKCLVKSFYDNSGLRYIPRVSASNFVVKFTDYFAELYFARADLSNLSIKDAK